MSTAKWLMRLSERWPVSSGNKAGIVDLTAISVQRRVISPALWPCGCAATTSCSQKRPMSLDVFADVATVKSIGVVPKILEVACRVTGAGFAGVARVTEDRWISCMVRDQIGFGLEPGSDLLLDNTFAQDIKQSRQTVIVEDAASDAHFADNPMAKVLGVQSYISVPIILANGSFFGTLCAIDRRPARLDTPATVGMFTLLAELIAHHLDEADSFRVSQASLADALGS